MPHDHGAAHVEPDTGDRRVSIAIWANGILTVAQIVGGILSGSLALIADALHNFSDMAALVIAFAARKIEGGMRIISPPEVQAWTVVVLGSIALVVDALTAVLTYSMQKGSVNIRALFLHNLSDALASVAVVVSGTLIILYDMWWIDPAITIGIAVYILYLSFAEIGGPIRTLMLGSPPDIDSKSVLSMMRGVEGVDDVHHVHLWQMEESEPALDCHVVLMADAWSRMEDIKSQIKRRLEDQFDISHSSLEFEHEHRQHQNADLYGHGRSEDRNAAQFSGP